MSPRPVIIDCDPGQDDAVALFLAMASPEDVDIVGITAVAGNVPLALTQRNARIMCDLAGRADVPVFAGCDRPMRRDSVTAEHVHGSTGIDGMDLFDPATPLSDRHAVDFLVEAIKAAPDEGITLVATGPLTNVATAFGREPGIAANVREIVLMGGASREGGNITPSAEFNIFVDPDAADAVFRCGRPLVVMGLDVTHQVISTPARVAAIAALDNPVARATASMLGFFHRHDSAKYGTEGGPLHDPCTVAWLLSPGLFEGKPCNVSVETASSLTAGHTAVDFWHVTDRPRNALWVHSVDADGFYDLLTRRLARFGGRAP